jgi:chromosome partitioning protein
MVTYAVANQKGGVGKTTVTLAIAAALAGRGTRVLVVDLDPQASATKVLGVDVEERPTTADAMLEPERFVLRESVCATEWGFDLAPSETALASRESRRAPADEFLLRHQLEGLAGYEVVLVDCPPSLGLLTVNALAAASRLLVVTEPSFLALQGIEELLETRELVHAHYNPALELAGVIVNRVERTVEHRDSVLELERHFGEEHVWSPHLPKRTAFQDAARRGVPLRKLRSAAGSTRVRAGSCGTTTTSTHASGDRRSGRAASTSRSTTCATRSRRACSPPGYRWSRSRPGWDIRSGRVESRSTRPAARTRTRPASGANAPSRRLVSSSRKGAPASRRATADERRDVR